jgi:predicted DNA-binding transcriptional regulator AlpA
VAVPDVMGVSEIAERLGVTKKRGDQIVKEKGFPDGRRLRMGTVWSTEDVETWIAAHRPQLNEPDAG